MSGKGAGIAIGRVGPLTHYRVIEVSTMVTAPLCGQILGDLGADVIKVETFEGDVLRSIPPCFQGHSAAFAQWNRNKRSIAVNLRSREGIDIVHRLSRTADAFVQNMRPGVPEKVGVGYGTMAAVNPRLIYLHLSGYGPSGPYEAQPGYDMVVQGLTGLMPIQGGADDPQPIRAIQADKIAGYSAAMAIMAALLHRENTGEGQFIDTNLLDSYGTFVAPELLYGASFLDAPPTDDNVTGIYNLLACADGKIIGFVMTDDQFAAACRLFGTPALRADPRFQTAADRNINQLALMSALGAATATLPVAKVIALARDHQIPFAPVNDFATFVDDPQARYNETLVEFDTPEVGRVRLANSFARFAGTPTETRRLAPALGAQTDEVMREAGFADAEITEYRERGIVA